MALNQDEIDTIAETVKQMNEQPQRLKMNEKIVTSGLTLIGIFFIGLIISILSLCITWVWRHILG